MPAVAALLPQIVPDAQSDPHQRHQRLDPVGDGPARAGRGGRDLCVGVGASTGRRRRRSCRSSSSTSSPPSIGIGLLLLIPVVAVRRAGDVADRLLRGPGRRRALRHRTTRSCGGCSCCSRSSSSSRSPRPTSRRSWLVRSFDAGEEQNVVNLAVLEIAFSVGMMLGGILVASLFAKRSRIGMIVTSSLVFGGLSIGMGLSPNIWVFFGFMFLVGPGRAVLLDAVDDAAAGDRRARAAGPRVRVRRHRDGAWRCRSAWSCSDRSPMSCRSRCCWSRPGVLTFVVVGAAVWLPAGTRAIAAARAAAAAPGDARQRGGRGRSGDAPGPSDDGGCGSPRLETCSSTTPSRSRTRSSGWSRSRSITPTTSRRPRRVSSTPGTPRCPGRTRSRQTSHSASPGATRAMNPWAVRRLDTDRVVGMTTFCNIDQPNRHVEIGHTWIGRRAPSAPR